MGTMGAGRGSRVGGGPQTLPARVLGFLKGRSEALGAGGQRGPGGGQGGVLFLEASRDLHLGFRVFRSDGVSEYTCDWVAQRKLAMGEALHLEAQPSPRLYSTTLQWHHPLSIQ